MLWYREELFIVTVAEESKGITRDIIMFIGIGYDDKLRSRETTFSLKFSLGSDPERSRSAFRPYIQIDKPLFLVRFFIILAMFKI